MPVIETPSAAPIRVDLATSLEQQLSYHFRGLRVHIGESGVVLEGRVSTYYAKQLAQHLVMRLTELPIAANEIEVR
jgi:hypothetical protein